MSRAVTKLNPERPLTRGELNFLRAVLDGSEPGPAAISAGIVSKECHPHDASMVGAQLLEEVQPAFRSMMAALGLSDRFVIGEISAGMRATIQKVFWAKDGEKFPSGLRYEVVDTNIPNWGVRKFYTSQATKLKMLLFEADLASEEDNSTRRSDILARQHRASLHDKTEEELNQILEQEAFGRQRVRQAVS